jgi:antitoxin ParD1/3/4
MGKLERITVALPEEVAAKVRAAVESGEYATEGEVVREALRDWTELQDRRQAALDRLREQITEGLKGPMLDGETVMAELRARVVAAVERAEEV